MPNGEVEGPPRSADQVPRAHTVFPRPRRVTTHRSRTPQTIVRGHQLTAFAHWRVLWVHGECTFYFSSFRSGRELQRISRHICPRGVKCFINLCAPTLSRHVQVIRRDPGEFAIQGSFKCSYGFRSVTTPQSG